jgi:hypothetical protein
VFFFICAFVVNPVRKTTHVHVNAQRKSSELDKYIIGQGDAKRKVAIVAQPLAQTTLPESCGTK